MALYQYIVLKMDYKWTKTCKGGNARFAMVPLKALSDQV